MMKRIWEFHLRPEYRRDRTMKEEKSVMTVKGTYVIEEWEKPKIYGEYMDDFYNEYICHDFVCLIFRTCKKDKEMEEEEKEEIEQLEKILRNGKKEFENESPFKDVIQEIQRRVPGKYVFLIVSTTGMNFVPIYIDRENVWHRIDIFPLNKEPLTERPEMSKLKMLMYSQTKQLINEIMEYTMRYNVELYARDPRIPMTQGIQLKIDVEQKVLRYQIKLMYHMREKIMREIFESELEMIHMRLETKDMPSEI